MAYDIKKTLAKVGVIVLDVALAGGAALYTNNAYWLVLVPVLTAIRNVWKHAVDPEK